MIPLYWKEIKVLPGSFIGTWEILSSNIGEEEEIISSKEFAMDAKKIELFPSPVHDYFQIEGNQNIYSFTIWGLNGQNYQQQSK